MKTVAQRFPERQSLIKQQHHEIELVRSAGSLGALRQLLQSLGICSELSARVYSLDLLYPLSLKEECDAAYGRGLAANRTFLQEMQPACENRLPNHQTRRGGKRAFWQMSDAERAKSNQSHSLRRWREGVVG